MQMIDQVMHVGGIRNRGALDGLGTGKGAHHVAVGILACAHLIKHRSGFQSWLRRSVLTCRNGQTKQNERRPTRHFFTPLKEKPNASLTYRQRPSSPPSECSFLVA